MVTRRTISHSNKREITLIVLGTTALIAVLAGISYVVIANHELQKKKKKKKKEKNQSSRGHLRPGRLCH
jgi:flagellar basal body-associated protein FliL